jgi:hypothetical protein
MLLTGSQANFMLHIASGRAPTGVPVPYDKSNEADAVYLEKFGLIERHHVGSDKVGAFFTEAGARVFAEILDAYEPKKG